MMKRLLLLLTMTTELAADKSARLATLRTDLKGKGWIAFSVHNERGDWDLYAMRPDGSQRTRLTDTPDVSEAGVRFSPDGKRMLFYRIPRGTGVDNNGYGTHELVIANADTTAPYSLGEGHTWASWSPDGTRLACLAPDGIHFHNAATGRDLGGKIPRHGLVQQLVWSPDGTAFCGTANGLGEFWNIGITSAAGGKLGAASETNRYNCTPDWMPDSQWLLYARGIVGGQKGWAELWKARRDGSERIPLYCEEGTHIYGACAYPDGEFLLFTRSAEDLGSTEKKAIRMAIIRAADAPQRVTSDTPADSIPRLDLGEGWEPHWTHQELKPR